MRHTRASGELGTKGLFAAQMRCQKHASQLGAPRGWPPERLRAQEDAGLHRVTGAYRVHQLITFSL